MSSPDKKSSNYYGGYPLHRGAAKDSSSNASVVHTATQIQHDWLAHGPFPMMMPFMMPMMPPASSSNDQSAQPPRPPLLPTFNAVFAPKDLYKGTPLRSQGQTVQQKKVPEARQSQQQQQPRKTPALHHFSGMFDALDAAVPTVQKTHVDPIGTPATKATSVWAGTPLANEQQSSSVQPRPFSVWTAPTFAVKPTLERFKRSPSSSPMPEAPRPVATSNSPDGDGDEEVFMEKVRDAVSTILHASVTSEEAQQRPAEAFDFEWAVHSKSKGSSKLQLSLF